MSPIKPRKEEEVYKIPYTTIDNFIDDNESSTTKSTRESTSQLNS